MSLLSLVSGNATGAAVRCGLTSPASLFGSSDPNAPLLIALVQEVGESLVKRHDWQRLKVDYTVPTLAAEAQTAIPADYDRMLPDGEMWNRTAGLKYVGPTDDARWGEIKALGLTGLYGYWRLIGGGLQITPAPAAGQTLAFPYMSKNWIRGDTGTAKSVLTADTDTFVIPERLLSLGLIWAWKNGKGFSYSEFLATHEREVELECSRDRGGNSGYITVGSRRSNGIGAENTYPGRIIA